MVRGNVSRYNIPYDPRYTGGATQTPSSSEARGAAKQRVLRFADAGSGSTRAVNQIKVGYDDFYFQALPSARGQSHRQCVLPDWAKGYGAPVITFSGLRIGQAHTNAPQKNGQVQWSFRDDYTTCFNAADAHTLKLAASGCTSGGRTSSAPIAWGLTTPERTGLPPTSNRCSRTSTMSIPGIWRRYRPLFRTYSQGISAVGFIQETPKEIGAGVDSGRLGGDIHKIDAQPRTALRRQQRTVRRTGEPPAVASAGTERSRKPIWPAGRLRLQR